MITAEEILYKCLKDLIPDIGSLNRVRELRQFKGSVNAMEEYASQFKQSSSQQYVLTTEKLKEFWYRRHPIHETNADTGEDMFFDTVLCVFNDIISASQFKQSSLPIEEENKGFADNLLKSQNEQIGKFFTPEELIELKREVADKAWIAADTYTEWNGVVSPGEPIIPNKETYLNTHYPKTE